MRRFTSAAHVRRFASVHGVVQNLFRVGRHLLRSRHHRVFRKRAFVEWVAAHHRVPAELGLGGGDLGAGGSGGR